MPSSRTPEGEPNKCDLCGEPIRIEPSTFPVRDAPCPHCGTLLQFDESRDASIRVTDSELTELLDRIAAMPRSPAPVRLVVDLQEFNMMSSHVIGKLIAAHRQAQARRMRLAVRNAHPEVLEVFRITKLDKLIEIVDA